MIDIFIQLSGGIGLFLVGMILLTEGLKTFAGHALQQALARFTGTPTRAFTLGALVTAAVQSSSATTVTLIGFVSAGLITFPQAVGVVIGASLGTTGTGWIISVLGLKISLGLYALPILGIGALMRLLCHGRYAAAGLALAGFGLIFVGIETMQNGMQSFTTVFDLTKVPPAGVLGYLAAVVIGLLMTVVMQSSSAAVATILTALHTHVVSFELAAVAVIGAAIGTTVTGALAAIGGSVPAKRTALAHVLFNLATGLIAILLLPLFLWLIAVAQRHLGLDPGAVSLAAFHTIFIGLGVVIFLPFVLPFSQRIERLLPDRGPRFTHHLDNSLLQVPPVAMEATRRVLIDILAEVSDALLARLRDRHASPPEGLRSEMVNALARLRDFFARIPAASEGESHSGIRVAQMHAMDHLGRLSSRLKIPSSIPVYDEESALRPAIKHTIQVLETVRQALNDNAPDEYLRDIEENALALSELRQSARRAMLQASALGTSSPVETAAALDALRWLERTAHHAWRACHYVTMADPSSSSSSGQLESALSELNEE